MRSVSLIALVAVLVLAAPALAGNATFTDGRGGWQSTKCKPPMSPNAALARDPETAANDLNEQIAKHNEYVAEAQAYMNCISQEAQQDADAASQSITRAAQTLIQQVQADVTSSAARLENKSVVVPNAAK